MNHQSLTSEGRSCCRNDFDCCCCPAERKGRDRCVYKCVLGAAGPRDRLRAECVAAGGAFTSKFVSGTNMAALLYRGHTDDSSPEWMGDACVRESHHLLTLLCQRPLSSFRRFFILFFLRGVRIFLRPCIS